MMFSCSLMKDIHKLIQDGSKDGSNKFQLKSWRGKASKVFVEIEKVLDAVLKDKGVKVNKTK